MKTVYMVCGVPGSGKTWVCEQLSGDIAFFAHDDYYEDYIMDVSGAIIDSKKTRVLVDCPFGERGLRGDLEAAGFDVRPYFIVESTSVVKDRYYAREGKELGKAHVTRSKTIIDRAIEWKAPYGTSKEILAMLKKELK